MRNEGKFEQLLLEEHDSCGVICIIEKDGHPTRENIMKTIDALIKMEHRSGFIDGEGDGCGILTDLPRALWTKKLEQAGLDGQLAADHRFSVAHIFVPRNAAVSVEEMQAGMRGLFAKHGFRILIEQENETNSDVLGPNGRQDEPTFWQVAGICEKEGVNVADELFELHIEIESEYNVHVASLSNTTAAYKVMGSASILPKYFKDTQDPSFAAQVTIGHNRYSTNTLSSFFRVQPFSLLGHNGEINTIKKMRSESDMIGVPLVDGGSDSQDMNRTLETLIHRHGFSLFEAMELVFPPIHNEIKMFRPELQDLYMYYRQIWGHYAQGPAAIVSRYANECVFSVDALGLRPLWIVESETSLYFSSEQGIITVGEMVAEPKSIAPGEKIGVTLTPGEYVQVVSYESLQTTVLERARKRVVLAGAREALFYERAYPEAAPNADVEVTDALYAAAGWDREGIKMIETMSESGAEPIRSLGHDGPLAALNPERVNIADFIKESVAVVTNPAIDRDREQEHFSTRVVFGPRAAIYGEVDDRLRVELPAPLLLEGSNGANSLQAIGQPSLEQLTAAFEAAKPGSVKVLGTVFARGTSLKRALEQLAQDAVAAVQSGATVIVLDDAEANRNDLLWIDPHVALSSVDIALRSVKLAPGDNLRRQAGIVLRSAAIRSLHDIAVACGLGADLVSPYALFATASVKSGPEGAYQVFSALQKGLEKVISTIGTHELRGYTRFFSSIGLQPEVAEVLDIVNYLGSEQAGTGFTQLEQDALKRYEDFNDNAAKVKPAKNFHFAQRFWKPLGDAASGAAPYKEYTDKLREEELKNPISIRHITDFDIEKSLSGGRKPLNPQDVDLRVGDHDLPMLISSMSFGSQNEIAFRAYAEAGERLNMVTMNGEGGEIKDMLGRYKRTRGAQIASGRFGVNVELANAVAFLEIKIGQGAKPGEGGHLPGSKVTAKIAEARNATVGSDLISPSNNHDIYSIEDLAQLISELKEASNHKAKIIVKIPIVPGIGTIAVGVAKAGANVITLSGFDGGTGAARMHSLQHVGLPTEIGTKLAHVALIEAGLRHKVELWSDGGLKSGADVVKLMMLGANRCGFATLAMQAIGCTVCRGCHLDTCHVGIATQIDSMDEAEEKGLRRFVPRVFDLAVDSLVRLFSSMGDEIREITAALGFKRAQDLVGRSDLLKQIAALEQMDLKALLRPAPLQFLAANTAAQAQEDNVLAETAAAAGAEGAYPAKLSFSAPIERRWSKVSAEARIVGSRFSSNRVRDRFDGSYDQLPDVTLKLTDGSVAGNGLGAFNARGVEITVQGGAEDGVGKMAFGGKIAILKSPGKNKQYVNGSVGKSFAYGAQKGTFIVQGNADTRACIRLSGADIIFGGELQGPLRDELGNIAGRANLKGFAFEYMTNGRAVVMGDPGPWICAGMTGGVIYQRLQPEYGLDQKAIQRRIAKGAKVNIGALDEKGRQDVTELLSIYHSELVQSGQEDAAVNVAKLLETPEAHFVAIRPVTMQADQSVATE